MNTTKNVGIIGTPEREIAGPRALTRILRLFDTLAKSSDGLSLAELNTVLESPKSSLLNLLRPLVADGYLMHSHGMYRLGPTAFRLAANIMSAWNFGKAGTTIPGRACGSIGRIRLYRRARSRTAGDHVYRHDR